MNTLYNIAITQKLLAIYNEIVEEDLLEDCYERSIEDFEHCYSINNDEATLLFTLVQLNFKPQG